ncbi:MAG: RNA polymerase sigma factor [Elusimicrobia bacterium]|nr:RNA polymerase sigma factor [Elusimicrobiota bacterium]
MNMEEIARLIETNMERAYSIACKLTGNSGEAADLVQNAFMKVLKNRGNYDAKLGFERWLYVIIRNLHVDALRRRRPQISGDPQDFLENTADPAPTPEKRAEQTDLRARIGAELKLLEPNLRAAIALVDMEGYSYEEAAEILKWPLGTVCVRLHRARKILRGKLTGLWNGGEK